MYILPIYKLLFWEPKRLTHESHEHLSQFHVNKALLGWTDLLFPDKKVALSNNIPDGQTKKVEGLILFTIKLGTT